MIWFMLWMMSQAPQRAETWDQELLRDIRAGRIERHAPQRYI